MTTGRGRLRLSAWSAHSPCSSTSARFLRIRTAARRTVQTLIGSKEAFRTRTRPDERPRCSGRPGPGSARTGPGSESPAPAASSGSARAATSGQSSQEPRPDSPVAAGIGAEHADLLHARPERLEGLAHRAAARPRRPDRRRTCSGRGGPCAAATRSGSGSRRGPRTGAAPPRASPATRRPAPQKTIEVLASGPGSSLSPAGASHTKRVTLSERSSTFSASTWQS